MDERYLFSPALPADLERVCELINARIAWMDEKGLQQWNSVDYWAIFPREHYASAIEAGRLYVLRREGRIAAATVLLEEDGFWSDGLPAFYIHNLVTDRSFPRAGRVLLEHCRTLALKRGKRALRLDCARDNPALNNYYEAFGFRLVGFFDDDPYFANLRELKLSKTPFGVSTIGCGLAFS